MESFIEISPFILAGIGLISLVTSSVIRIVSKQKAESKPAKIISITGFTCLFLAAGFTAWIIFASF